MIGADTASLLVEILGWMGAVLVLVAYLLVSVGGRPGTSPAYLWLNAIGAAFFVLNTWWHGAIPSMVLNIIWSGIGFGALWKIYRRGLSGPPG